LFFNFYGNAYNYISVKEVSNEPGYTVIINDVGAMELVEASTQVFVSIGRVLAECEAALSGTADSAHVASVDDPVGGSVHSAMTLLLAAGALTLTASSTSAITRKSGNILAVGDPLVGSEHSPTTLLQASGASTLMASTTSAIARTSSNILAGGNPVSGSKHFAITLLQAASDALKFTLATTTARSTAVTKLNEVVEPPNRGHDVGILKVLELAGRAEHLWSM
jgi:hypothetical protein